MLTIIKIEGRTPDTAQYDPGYFITDGYTIYSYSPAIGFSDRPDMDKSRLNAHIERMKHKGFTIIIQEV